MALLFGSSVCLSVTAESSAESRPLATRMSSSGLTSEAQLRYILQWFGEFSELQREDFLPILAAARADQSDQLATLLANISCDDKPVSLFQCRIKLFNEWYPSWTEEEQDRLLKGVTEVDSDFGEKLQDLMINGPKVNGENGLDESHSPIEDIKTDESLPDDEHPEVIEETLEPVVENIPVEIAAAS